MRESRRRSTAGGGSSSEVRVGQSAGRGKRPAGIATVVRQSDHAARLRRRVRPAPGPSSAVRKAATRSLSWAIFGHSEVAEAALSSASAAFCWVISSMWATAWLISSMPLACSPVAAEISATVADTFCDASTMRPSASPADAHQLHALRHFGGGRADQAGDVLGGLATSAAPACGPPRRRRRSPCRLRRRAPPRPPR